MNPVRLLPGLLCCVAMLASPVQAGIYKWVDEEGQVHYGERPVNRDAERLQIRTRAAAEPSTEARDPDDKDKPEQSGKDDPQATDEQQQPQATPDEIVEAPLTRQQRRRLCASARTDLDIIQSSPRLRADDGSRRILSEKERQRRLRLARQDIRKYCR